MTHYVDNRLCNLGKFHFNLPLLVRDLYLHGTILSKLKVTQVTQRYRANDFFSKGRL